MDQLDVLLPVLPPGQHRPKNKSSYLVHLPLVPSAKHGKGLGWYRCQRTSPLVRSFSQYLHHVMMHIYHKPPLAFHEGDSWPLQATGKCDPHNLDTQTYVFPHALLKSDFSSICRSSNQS